ncbi:MAG: arginase [Aggregatilineales bacterium]
MSDKPTIRIFGVPMDLGQQRRGVDMGPSAVRYAELQDRLIGLGYAVKDHGNVHVPAVEEVRKLETDTPDPVNAHHLSAVARVCHDIYTQVTENVLPSDVAICLGGDHSIAIGTVSATAQRAPCGVIWVDAHADFNIPDCSPSGNIHGMALAALLGDGPPQLTSISAGHRISPAQIVMIGLRSVDPEERGRLHAGGIKTFTMTDIDEYGIATIAHQTFEHLHTWGGIHVSLDMDSLDPDVAPGVGTPVRGGLTYREAHLLMELLAESGLVRALDIVEVNPILDNHNQTAELAVELAASLFGLRTL